MYGFDGREVSEAAQNPSSVAGACSPAGVKTCIESLGLNRRSPDPLLEGIVRSAARMLDLQQAGFQLSLPGDARTVASYGSPDALDADDPGYPEQSPRQSDAPPEQNALATAQAGDAVCASVPVTGPLGSVIGYLWVADPSRRVLNAEEVLDLENQARQIEQVLELRNRSVRDEVTGLYNRRFLNEQIDREWRRAMRQLLPVSYVLVDVDHFKAVNDNFGHMAGDRTLARIGQLLDKLLRRAGDTAARYGGDEFAMILPVTPEAEAHALVDRLLDHTRTLALEHPTALCGRVTLSAGLACAQTEDDLNHHQPNRFFEYADTALYQAKSQGRDRVVSYSQLQELGAV